MARTEGAKDKNQRTRRTNGRASLNKYPGLASQVKSEDLESGEAMKHKHKHVANQDGYCKTCGIDLD